MTSPCQKRILVIDDEVNVRLVVQACLENLQGWFVLLAASAEEGLMLAETEKPDAILLDGMMPGMDGTSFLRELQARPAIRSIPVIFLTAIASLTEPEHYLKLGAKGAIVKPFNPFTLTAQITEILHW
jgi:CheY-like chemotaxis protein